MILEMVRVRIFLTERLEEIKVPMGMGGSGQRVNDNVFLISSR
jgi:hypothetical protein